MNYKLKNKSVVVTGGSKGIGFAVCREFLKEGAIVTFNARKKDEVENAVEELSLTQIDGETPESLKSRIHGVVCDGTDESAVTELAKFAAGHSEDNSIAAWVNNIGTNKARAGEDYTDDALDKLMENNLLGRMAEPEEVAKAVLFLASPVSSYITGTSLEISGGHNTVLNPEYAFLKKENE